MDPRLEAAFAAVPREGFLPEGQRPYAYQDAALDIGYGVTNSQPTTVRNMLHLLDVRRGQRVLDVGTGSGWTTALLAELVGPTGEVVGVERIPEVLEMGLGNVGDRYPWVDLHLAQEGVLGWPEGAPYDRVLVSAAATRLPQELLDQLEVGGVMVVPVRNEMLRVTRTEDEPDVERCGRYSFVPLIGG
jgi:protein-L-isoaspartate(D-aspartate) O-methyltransferase